MKEWKNPHQKKYYFKNRNKILEGQKKAKRDYYYRNKEAALEQKRIYKANNPEKVKKWRKTWYDKHREEIRLKAKLKREEKNPPTIKNCLWCLDILTGTKTKFCSSRCHDQHKVYNKRMGPIWMWRLYSKYKIYKIFYHYIPKIKSLFVKKIPKFFIKIFLKSKKKLIKLKTLFNYYHVYGYKTKKCNHWIFYISKGKKSTSSNKRNFCSDKCKQLDRQKIIENKKQRNLAAWGTEHRPDEETRRIIKNKKHAEWDKQKKIDDPAHKLIRRMRLRTKKVLGVNYRRTTRMTDVYTRLCIKDGQELKQHLESLWKPGMSWENYGSQTGWVIDHIIPLKYYKDNFDLANDVEIQKKAFGIQNLQPLWWLENAKKSAKLNYESE
jgi:endogenous inhibitor of DNA gyrase (YacG/DUF329 family)